MVFYLIDKRLVFSGGDALCCGHPNGHKRSLHYAVRNRLRQLRRQHVRRENILGGGPERDYVDFVVNNDK